MTVRVGISGWTFPPWRGVFYPKGLVQSKELEYASRQLSTIEINGTFYGLQKPKSFQQWYSQTPEDFVFSVKATQYITHVKRLKDVTEALATFIGSGVLCLKQKLGAILWQFPPNVTLKDDRFERFFELLPKNHKQAAQFARDHSHKLEGGSWTDVEEDYPLRHAFEFRHGSFADPAFMSLMRRHGVAFVVSHASEKAPFIEEPTADFIYARMHGEGKGFFKGYTSSSLKNLAKHIQSWPKKDAFIYFSTDQKRYAPANALDLSKLISISSTIPKK